MQIVVTGAAGYIGSHTVVELMEAGYDPIIIDNLSNSDIGVVERIGMITGRKPAFEQVDCTDLDALDAVFTKYGRIDAVIHFAASKAVGESVKIPITYYRNNLNSLLNVLTVMARHNTLNLVFSSSCTVYGQPDTLPVTENSPIKPATSPYGNTKQVCEEIIRDTAHSDANLHATLLRYFNPIGAHKSALIGELPIGVPQNLIPYVTQTAIGIRQCLRIFGNDYNTPDGSCIRDYIYVGDLAKAHVKAVERMINDKAREQVEVFNIGTGKGTSVIEIVEAFEKATGVKLNHEFAPRREGDIEQVWADTSYANTELGWKATTSLEETLLTAWNWEKNYRNK